MLSKTAEFNNVVACVPTPPKKEEKSSIWLLATKHFSVSGQLLQTLGQTVLLF